MTKPETKPARRLRYSAIELLGALVLMLIVAPFLEDVRHGGFIEAMLLTVVFVSAMFAVGADRSTLWIGGILTTLAISARWAEHFFPSEMPHWLFPPLALVFLGFIIVHLVRSTMRARVVDVRVLCAAIAAYLMIGMLWTMAYMLVGRLSPDAFAFSTGPEISHEMNRFNAFYFSFVTLSTVGYGDIAPVSKAARMLAVGEAMTGMLYVAVLIARLVSLYSAVPPKPVEE